MYYALSQIQLAYSSHKLTQKDVLESKVNLKKALFCCALESLPCWISYTRAFFIASSVSDKKGFRMWDFVGVRKKGATPLTDPFPLLAEMLNRAQWKILLHPKAPT